MSIGGLEPTFASSTQHHCDWSVPRRALKRKSRSLELPDEPTYPSPPMSRPPSPPPPPPRPELPPSSVTEPPAFVPTTTAHASISYQSPLSSAHSAQRPLPPYYSNVTDISPYAAPLGSHQSAQYASVGAMRAAQEAAVSGSSAGTGSLFAGHPPNQIGRKSKAHVASACVNCKRAHLSCDIQRPCLRCVASGKQETCLDVPHKKRGRPRLREQGGESKAEQAAPESSGQAASSSVESTPRPIATPRRRRTDSLRTIRSQASDTPSSIAPSFPHGTLQPSFNYHQAGPPPGALSPRPPIPTTPGGYPTYPPIISHSPSVFRPPQDLSANSPQHRHSTGTSYAPYPPLRPAVPSYQQPSYPSYSQPPPYSLPPLTPRYTPVEPPTQMAPFAAHPTSTQAPQLPPASLLLPPIGNTPTTSPGPSSARVLGPPAPITSPGLSSARPLDGSARRRRSSDDDEEGEGSSKKRRRMGIEDVLHR